MWKSTSTTMIAMIAPCHRWRQVRALIVALGLTMSSAPLLHAQEDQRERSLYTLDTLAEDLLKELRATLPNMEGTSVAMRPLWVNPDRLSRLPDDVLNDLDSELFERLRDQFLVAGLKVQERHNLMNAIGTRQEYRGYAAYEEELRRAEAEVEVFCTANWTDSDIYHIQLDCSAVQLQERAENAEVTDTATNAASADGTVAIRPLDVFDVQIADLAAKMVEGLVSTGSDLRTVELHHAEFEGDARSTTLRDRLERKLGFAVRQRIHRHYQWGASQSITGDDQEGKATKYRLYGIVTCFAAEVELELMMYKMKDGENEYEVIAAAHEDANFPVEILPATCADAGQVILGVTVTNASRVYGGRDDLTYTVTGLTDGDAAGQVLDGGLDRVRGSDVGTYRIIFGTLAVKSAFTRKYVLPEASTLGSYTITPKEVTVDSAVLTKEYDGAPRLNGAQLTGGEVSGAVSGQSLTLRVTGGSYATVDVGTGITITGPTFALVAGANTNQDDYALPSSIDLTGTITKKATAFTGAAASRVYDGTDVVSTAIRGTFSPKLIDDDVVTIHGGVYGSADAGTNIAISGATFGGADAGNYAVTAAISGTIAAQPITAIDGVTVVSRVMDRAATASFDTTEATGMGVLASELAGFRAGGLVVNEASSTADAGTHGVSVRYALANSGTFKAGNYELGNEVETAILQPALPAQPSSLQMKPPPQPREIRRPVRGGDLGPSPDSWAYKAIDDAAFERARAENTMESYAAYLRSFPNGGHVTEAYDGVYAVAPTIGVNEEQTGTLTDVLTTEPGGRPVDVWILRGDEGAELRVDMVTDEFDAFLYAAGDEIQLEDDDSGGGTNARILLALPPSGQVTIGASAYDNSSRGQYLLRTRTAAAAQDDEAYERARAEHTVESYWAYLMSFPSGRHQVEAWDEVYAGSPTIGVNEERSGTLTGDMIHWETDAPVQVWTLHGDEGTGLYVELLTNEFDAYLMLWDDTVGHGSDLDWVDGTNAGTLIQMPPLGKITLIAGASAAKASGRYLLRTRTFPTIGVNEERTGSLSTDFIYPETQAPIEAWTLRGEAGTVLYVDVLTDQFDAVLLATDSGGSRITYGGDLVEGFNARNELTIPSDGVAMLYASASDWSSSLRGDYRLRTRTPEEEARLAQEAARDDDAYRRAESVGSSASYDQYLTNYPNGRHADEARRLLAEARDDEAYEQAQAEDTSSAYKAYLHGYANGRHVGDARRMLAAALSREERRSGRRFRDCDDCPLMVVVPPGSYMMGSPESARRRERDERPQHIVTIEYPLAVGEYEVTLAEYRRFVASTDHSARRICWRWDGKWSRYNGTWSHPGYRQTDRDPVVCVSWEDAMEYVRWLSRETGEKYRLLSEAEWEYVARGGTNTARYWGEESAESYFADESAKSQCRYANGADRSLRKEDRHQDWEWEYAACDDGYPRTAPVGTYDENGFGLHDALGNVWEWTQDCKSENYDGAPSDGSSWESDTCDRRVIRGGSWSDELDIIRSANRGWANTDHRDYTLGFRVARDI